MNAARQQAEAFDQLNPDVWARFQSHAFDAINAGVRQWSAKAIWEIMRWNELVRGTRGDVFKLRNDYHAYYARKFRETHPKHAEFFNFRASQFDQDEDSPQADLFDI